MGRRAAFIKEVVKNPYFWVRQSACSTGVTLITESALGLYFLPALSLIVTASSVAVCGLLVGCGLYSAYVGATGTWRVVKDSYCKTFNKPNPPAEKKVLKLFCRKLAQI